MSAAEVKALRDFRSEQFVDRRSQTIVDEETRRLFADNLTTLATSKDGAKRATAFNSLRNLLESDLPLTDEKALREVVIELSAAKENKNNPSLQFLRARIEMENILNASENAMFSPQEWNAKLKKIDDAVALAEGATTDGQTKRQNGISRAERSALSAEASRLREKIGERDNALFLKCWRVLTM